MEITYKNYGDFLREVRDTGEGAEIEIDGGYVSWSGEIEEERHGKVDVHVDDTDDVSLMTVGMHLGMTIEQDRDEIKIRSTWDVDNDMYRRKFKFDSIDVEIPE